MSKFVNQDITATGLQMLSNALQGSITFTKIVLDSGYTDKPAREMEALVQPENELEVVKLVKALEPGTAVIGAVFSNIGLKEDL